LPPGLSNIRSSDAANAQPRDENDEVIDFVMDATGVWQLSREPIDRKIARHDDLAR
jgi:hypothetical protein